ncbi:MAG: hypothetical protein AAFZ15_22255 [Bacteroidota bacterium]
MIDFLKNNKWHFELAARIYAFALLATYGSGKILGGQFYRAGKIPEEIARTPLGEVGSFDLAWTFFGHSEWYIYFIGGSQLVGAFLLLFEKTKLIGAAILIPILLNIIVVDYCFRISWGAMTSAIFYFLALCFVLYCNRIQITIAFKAITDFKMTATPFRQRLIKIIVAVGIVAVIFTLEQLMLNFLGR